MYIILLFTFLVIFILPGLYRSQASEFLHKTFIASTFVFNTVSSTTLLTERGWNYLQFKLEKVTPLFHSFVGSCG